MSLVGIWSASSRRAIVMSAVAAFFCAASVVSAQEAPAAEAPAPQADAPAEPDPFQFSSSAAIVMWQINPASTADFEAVWSRIRAAAGAATAMPGAKALLDSISIYKNSTHPAGQPVTYFFQIDPVDSSASYSPTEFLYSMELFERAEADEMFATLQSAVSAINTLAVEEVQ